MELEAGDFKFRGGGSEFDVEGSEGVGLAQSKTLDGAGRAFQERRELGIVAVGQQEPVARNEANQATEGRLDGGEVLENVGVIEFEIIDDGDLGQVMDELAAFIEEGGIVLVAFDNEPGTLCETRPLLEVAGDAANQVTWV